jgi:GNAT superfamily N-acetyltransferase
MGGELVPSAVDPTTAGADFWKRYHAFRRLRQKETRPDDPVRSDADAEALVKRPDPFQLVDRFEVSHDGVMLSWFTGYTVSTSSPEYTSKKHLYEADFYVVRDHRRRGIGASWLPVVLELMDRHGRTTVGFWTEEESGHEFLKRAGAEARLSSIESRLKLSEVDWTMLERWVVEGASRSPRTRLEVFDGHLPEAMWPDYAPQLSAMLNTIPFEALDHGEIVITPERMHEWYARLDLSGEVQHTVMTREPEGVISGITDTTWAPYRPALIHQQFTGVRPEARGRGLGKWIKSAMLLHLRELYPDAEWVATDNAGSNAPMLKINRALGFKPYRQGTEYQITRDELAKRLAKL